MRRKLKSILVLVPADPEKDEVTAFRNYGEHTKEEMFELADGWLEANPGGMVMYDDDQITPEVAEEKEPEEGIIIDGLYVPPHALYAVSMKWGARK